MHMIRSIKGSATRQFVEHGKSRFSGMDIAIAHVNAHRRLRQINTASSLQALAGLNSVGLHKLKGDLRDFWSVDVNAGWRILFRFKDGDAYDVHILDPH
jgi:toxin HigB-1